MTLSEQDLEARLRRTLAAVAEAPLDDAEPMSTRRRAGRPVAFLVAAAAVVAVVVVAAALVDGDDRVTTVADGGESTRPEGEGSDRAVADYMLTPEEGRALFAAEQRLVAECMEKAGQPYFEISPSASDREPEWSHLGRTDAELAERMGYVVPEGGAGGRHPVMDKLRTDEERNAWSMALMGEPFSSTGGATGPTVPIIHPVTGVEVGRQGTGGCFGEADRALYGDQARYASLRHWVTNDVRNEVEQKAVGDPRFAEGERSWSGCMQDRGYEYKELFDPVKDFNQPGDEGPTAKERAVALADVECKEVTGLVHTYRKLHAEHGGAMVAQHGALLAEYRSIVDRALATARALPERPMTTTTTCCDG